MKANHPNRLLKLWHQKHLISLILVLSVLVIVHILLWQFDLLQITFALGSMAIIALLSIVIYRRASPDLDSTIRLSHSQNKNLEHSTRLLLEDKNQLSGLAALQRQKAEETFGQVDYQVPVSHKMIQQISLIGTSMLVFSLAIQFLMGSGKQHEAIEDIVDIDTAKLSQEALPPKDSSYIRSLSIRVSPPSYTGLSATYASVGSIEVVEGATLIWKLDIAGENTQSFILIGNESDTSFLGTPHSFSRSFREATFFRYGFKSPSNDFVSDYYSIKVIPDEAPRIVIEGINEYEKLSWAEDHLIDIDIKINDEYGIDQTLLTATVAKGSGESVKFREKSFPLKAFVKGQKSYVGSYQFSTKALDMEPGSELYFHIKAKDNCPYEEQWTKSKTFFVAIQDTAEYEYVDDMGMQVDLMPDFFRSQRQIIIDTEKLLAEKGNMSIDSFKRASNSLGYDQKMLRLKYGQFLGEENESGIAINNEIEAEEGHEDHDHDDHEGHDHDEVLSGARNILSEFMHDHDHEEEAGQLMSTKGTEKADPARPTWVEELSHNHDNMEEATFHDVSVKSKLKAALSEMWDAELHLRLYDPDESLPYQYESLKYLQEVKNHARIYVHRIGFDPPVIKESEKRLSGEQDKIIVPNQELARDRDDAYAEIKEGIKNLESNSSNQNEVLAKISAPLAQIALDRPDVLPVLSMIQNALRSDITLYQIQEIRLQLVKILPPEVREVKNDNIFTHNLTKQVIKNLRS